MQRKGTDMTRHLGPFIALALAAPAGPGLAQGSGSAICGQRDQIVAHLRSRLGEEVRATGLAGPTRILEVFVSDVTGSWTITVTSVDGTTCLMASGRHYEPAPRVAPGEPM